MAKRFTTFLIIVLVCLLFTGLWMKLGNQSIESTVLSVFSTWKKVNGNGVRVDDIYKNNSKPLRHVLFTELLNEFVDRNGMVDYEKLLSKHNNLKTYLQQLKHDPPNTTWTRSQQLAYWINAYNAFTLDLILRNYPLKSIKELGGNLPMINSTWDIRFIEINGIDLDLNTIEHEILRKRFNEPRIHFAINCASISCPALLNEAYESEILEVQLQQQAVRFINDDTRNSISISNAKVSPIFKWFRGDFTKESTLKEYINQYSKIGLNSNVEIEFGDYDWSLNRQ